MTDHRKPAVIYARTATRKPVPFNSLCDTIAEQLRVCRAAAEAQGYDVMAVFHEVASGNADKRPMFQKMLAYLEAHRAEAPTVFIENTHRLARSVGLVYKLTKMIDAHGGKVHWTHMDRTPDRARASERIERERD